MTPSLHPFERHHEHALPQAPFHVEGGGPLAVEDRELAGSLEYLAYLLPIVPLTPQAPAAQIASFHVEGEGPRERWRIENSLAHKSTLHVCVLRCTTLPINCTLRCTVLPISHPRRLSPTTNVVPPLSEKEGFVVHHPLPSIMSNSLRGCTASSLLPCGRRGTACGGG